MTLYNKIFQESSSLQNEEELYLIIAWQLYKARKQDIPESKITKVITCTRYLNRYWIPGNDGKIITKDFFACEINEMYKAF